MAGVLRPRAGRLDSPSNRYAGDWSRCRETYLQPSCLEEADYDDVPSEEPPNAGQEEQEDLSKGTRDIVSKLESPELDRAVERVEEMQIEEEEEGSEEENTIVFDKLQVEEPLPTSPYDQILPEHRPKEHTYQAYMKIQEISPGLSNRVNLRDLQESIDALIGNLERELNKNKLNIGYWLFSRTGEIWWWFPRDISAMEHSCSHAHVQEDIPHFWFVFSFVSWSPRCWSRHCFSSYEKNSLNPEGCTRCLHCVKVVLTTAGAFYFLRRYKTLRLKTNALMGPALKCTASSGTGVKPYGGRNRYDSLNQG